uniref:Uncharacterized protein n=1 Tax=Avena sativa TaxID=4498 RepID=A0ACD5UNN5_AVESA
MQISAEALHGISGATTLSVLVHIGGYQATALIDTGSTNTFLDNEFVRKAKLPVQKTGTNTSLVAGGGQLISEGHIPDCKFRINKTNFTQDCKLLPLKGYDMVLGANWLTVHSPNYYDWAKTSISITVNGEWCALMDRVVPMRKNIISAKACCKLLNNGAHAFLIRIPPPKEQPDQQQEVPPQVPDTVKDILDQF